MLLRPQLAARLPQLLPREVQVSLDSRTRARGWTQLEGAVDYLPRRQGILSCFWEMLGETAGS